MDDIEYFNERAAILEFDAGFSRKEAQEHARIMTEKRRALLDNQGVHSLDGD